MPFDLEMWKQKVQERLQGWRPRMQAAGVHTVYGFLSALALWPLVEAVQAGQLLPVVRALGSRVLCHPAALCDLLLIAPFSCC